MLCVLLVLILLPLRAEYGLAGTIVSGVSWVVQWEFSYWRHFGRSRAVDLVRYLEVVYSKRYAK